MPSKERKSKEVIEFMQLKSQKPPEPAPSQAEGNYKIENVVATATFTIIEKIDLNQIARAFTDVEYDPERFPGLVMRIKAPKATLLIFSTGKMVITGLRDASEAIIAVNQTLERIKKCKIKAGAPEVIIQNIVASGDIHCWIDLNMATMVMDSSLYEPEVFPGLIYRMAEPKSVFLIFSTGKIICTGIKTKDIVAEAVKKLYHLVREYGVAREPDQVLEEAEEEDLFSL